MVSQDLQDRRAYLGSYADRYFGLLPSGGHQQLPIAPGVVFTENGQRLRLGQGLWATATGAARTRAVTVLDGPAGQIATWGMVTEAGHDAILGVRLRVDAEGLIDEIDTFVVRFNDMSSTFSGSGLLDAQRLARRRRGCLTWLTRATAPAWPSSAGRRTVISTGCRAATPASSPLPMTAFGSRTASRRSCGPTGCCRAGRLTRDRDGRRAAGPRGRHPAHRRGAGPRHVPHRPVARACHGPVLLRPPGKVRGWQGRAPFMGPNSMPAWEVFRCGAG